MSQDPLRSIRRRTPRPKAEFPNALYRELELDPAEAWALAVLGPAGREAWMAHLVVRAETRAIERADATEIARALLDWPEALDPAQVPNHPLAALEQRVLAPAAGALRLGAGREEIVAVAGRMIVRERLLDLAVAVVGTRQAVAAVAGQHLTTMVTVTSLGQSVQATSLAHMLTAWLGPLNRGSQRIRQAFERVNRSPAGAVSGVSTAVPVNRDRSAALLGFEGAVENTLDALTSDDWVGEVASIVASLGRATAAAVATLSQWARDEVGTIVPGAGFVHAGTGQPQRRDPRILDHLAARAARMQALVVDLALLPSGGLVSEPHNFEAVRVLTDALEDATSTLRLFAETISGLEIDRAMTANRTNRVFSTSSELAELLAVDFKLPASQAYELTELIVAEALRSGVDATTLRPELIDRAALNVLGREIGIEPETLSRCLAPRRFIERRDVPGGPAPAAVSESLERETFLSRQESGWLADARGRLAAAREALHERVAELAGESAADG